MRTGEVLEAPTLHCPRGHGLREGGDSRDCVASNTAAGKLRHMETRVLWSNRECRFALCRVAGKDDPAHSHEAAVVGRDAGEAQFMLKESLSGGGLIIPCREPASEGSVL